VHQICIRVCIPNHWKQNAGNKREGMTTACAAK